MRSATIFNFLIEANIMASIAILLMIPLRKLLRKQMGNSVICFGWLLFALRLLIPLTLPNPLIHEIRPAYLDDTAIRPIAGQIKVRVVDAIGDNLVVIRVHGNGHSETAEDRLDRTLELFATEPERSDRSTYALLRIKRGSRIDTAFEEDKKIIEMMECAANANNEDGNDSYR